MVRIQKTLKSLLFAALAAFAFCGTAQATLIGDQVGGVFEASTFAPGLNLWDGTGGTTTATPVLAIVGPGSEFEFGPVFADFGASTLQIGVSFDGALGTDLSFDFSDLDWVGAPGSITGLLIGGNDFAGVTFGFTGDSINVEIPNQVLQGTSLITFDILATHAVPEPATLALLGLGIAALGFTRKQSA